jgi:hypothetical protein
MAVSASGSQHQSKIALRPAIAPIIASSVPTEASLPVIFILGGARQGIVSLLKELNAEAQRRRDLADIYARLRYKSILCGSASPRLCVEIQFLQ